VIDLLEPSLALALDEGIRGAVYEEQIEVADGLRHLKLPFHQSGLSDDVSSNPIVTALFSSDSFPDCGLLGLMLKTQNCRYQHEFLPFSPYTTTTTTT
jgi:hypothetical protein